MADLLSQQWRSVGLKNCWYLVGLLCCDMQCLGRKLSQKDGALATATALGSKTCDKIIPLGQV